MSIPMSDIITINPSVLSAGGNALALNGLILTKNTDVPTGGVMSFGNASLVGLYFGTASDEYKSAVTYFSGYDNSYIKPSQLWIAPFVDVARAAWIKSGDLSSMTLAQLQALSGTLIVDVDGTTFTSSTINLATATSFSDAAVKIAAGFSGAGKPTCSYNATQKVFQLTSPTTGATSRIGYATGTLADSLKFTSATAAILSQGADVDTVDTAMLNVTDFTQNWATFTTIWQPDTAGKTAFAQWATAQNSRYLYVAWDSDGQAIVNGSTTAFGVIAKTAQYDGVMCVYNNLDTAIYILGLVASIDFSRRNGRITGAFKKLSGFEPMVTSKAVADVLLANGYSFYGRYATANDAFNFLYNGQLSGKWLWLDTYVNQIYMNAQFQLSLVTLLTNAGSVPYNEQGYGLVRAALMTPINDAKNFGAIRSGVALSETQKALINSVIGMDVSGDIYANGFYLQILDPTAQVRQNRGTPVINFYYTDGGSIQKITMPSIDVI